MPRITQYIRDEDFKDWCAIENKSQWIHERLNSINDTVLDYSFLKIDPNVKGKVYNPKTEEYVAAKIVKGKIEWADI